MFRTLVLFFALLPFAEIGQSNAFLTRDLATSFNWDYYHQLHEEANRVYPNSKCTIFDLDSLNNTIFDNAKAFLKMDTTSNWKLLFEYTIGWTYMAGSPTSLINLIPDSLPAPKKNVKYAYTESKKYSGRELFNGLEIDSFFLSKDSMLYFSTLYNIETDSLYNFPAIRDRDHPFNRVWTPILSGEYLLLRYVHSYPDGNLTSSYNEIVLYFKRV